MLWSDIIFMDQTDKIKVFLHVLWWYFGESGAHKYYSLPMESNLIISMEVYSEFTHYIQQLHMQKYTSQK
jgi:hypothetical protein